MRSTFMGLETAKRGMSTQQNALYVTGHNISNANTPGYSRQRVNFETTTPYPAIGLNRPNIPGQLGTGVEAGAIQRMRESFLDVQYRNENNKLGYWNARADALVKVEDIINEPTEEGLAATISEMWKSLQVLAGSPENEGARGVVLERIQSMTDTFNYMSDSLNTIKTDFGSQVGITVDALNSTIRQLFDVNQQIAEIEPNGYLPNDLYDKRDLLVDELSQYVNVEVSTSKSGGNAPAVAEGIYSIKLLNADGTPGQELLNKDHYFQLGFENSAGTIGTDVQGDHVDAIEFVQYDRSNEAGASTTVHVSENGSMTFSQGSLRGLIEAFGYIGTKDTNGDGTAEAGVVTGIYQDMLDNLDRLAFSMAELFNTVHEKGMDYNGSAPTKDVIEYEVENPLPTGKPYAGAAGSIGLNVNLTSNELAASLTGFVGDGKNALNLSNVGAMLLNNNSVELLGGGTLDISNLDLPIKSGSLNSFYESVIGRLGVDSQQAQRMEQNVEVLRSTVVTNRESVSSVSLDEEMTNLIKFQHAYNGAARMITIVDEMLDKIINGMGVAGR
ncbi:flagellar hook-associated protein FlgK [Domibacillus tundrae]|uniref:flagellar hook-associated protein FlgK n=1 Tax=Domibacillus tundrae TaxID=1587527 RepID=UPI000617D78D|nr:flagellar hook-associated protein FlgK [Domibacillus tundrae]